LKKKFDQEYDLQEVCVKTASPYLGNLNSGLQLYLLKQEKPKVFEQVKYALHLPEFFCHLLTKEKVSGLPSIGCHTLLWDFKSEDYHSWVKSENILSKLAPTFPSVHTFQITKAKEVIQVGIGLHDSSAALIPYLKKIKEPFALISTGTWSISLNPFNHSELTQDELNKDCLRYLSYDGKPVKASRLLIGPEHDEQVNRMAEHFHVNTNFFKSIAFEKENLPLKEIGHFAKCNLNEFTDSSKAYHAFVRSLVTRQVASTQLILNNSSVKAIYVDGGFSSNPVYMNLLATELRQYKLFGTTISQASALGAALSLHSKWNNTNENDQISIVPY
jgi:sugar (pentulose or hexulose) kinase